MISIITTNYNYSKYISQAINSILTQTFKDFEYIIIDDGSTDDSISVIENFDDHRIRFFKIDHIGRAAALNFAIKHSKYDIIALMDADDISHPQRIEKEIEQLKNENQIIFCDAAYFDKKKILYVNNSPESVMELKKKILLHGHLNNSSAMFYKNLLIRNNGYDETLFAYEDYDFWMRIFNNVDFITLNKPLHFIRLHNRSLTTSNQSKNKSLLYSIQEKYFNKIDSLLIIKPVEKIKLKAWREFFFGDVKKCREYWKLLKLKDIEIRIILVFFLSYLPKNLRDFIINKRFRLRLKYLFRKRKSFKNLQNDFYKIYINHLN